MKHINLKVARVEKETNDCKAIYFEQPEEPLSYKSGQFLTFILTVDGKEERRSYSICTSEHTDQHIGVGVKRVENGVVSNYLNDNVHVGDEFELLEPMGNFTYDPTENTSKHLLLIAGGSGITPMMSILKTALSSSENVFVHLLYVNKSKDDVIFKDEIKTLQKTFSERIAVIHYLDSDNVKVEIVKKKGISGIFGGKKKLEDKGFITEEKLVAQLKDLNLSDDTEVYLCGPRGLMEIVESALSTLNFDENKLHKESFVTPPVNVEEVAEVVSDSVDGALVKVKIGGKEDQFTVKKGMTILQAGLSQGIEMPFSCQGGICTACMGTCTSGVVKMENEDSLTPKEIEKGFVLTCIGHAESPEVTIEFD